MKSTFRGASILFLMALVLTASMLSSCKSKFLDGDIVFHHSVSSQSTAVSNATDSELTHMGIICFIDGEIFVFEAINTTTFTPLKEWKMRGESRKYIVMRLKTFPDDLTSKIPEAVKYAKTLQGKSYDSLFLWSDDEIYCSELVWKVYYYGLGIKLCELKRFADYDLSSSEVARIIQERYKGNFPKDELVVAPSDIYNSPLLKRIK